MTIKGGIHFALLPTTGRGGARLTIVLAGGDELAVGHERGVMDAWHGDVSGIWGYC